LRILVIFTGGTIGCAPPDGDAVLGVGAGGADAGDWRSYYLLTSFMEKSKSEYRDGVTFDVMSPLNVLSENMTVAKWAVLVKALKGVDFSPYDGVVITHGSDTLAYTASFLGILLSGAGLPIVLVAANKNLYDPLTNGHQNFNAALDFIRRANSPGVYASYSYDREKTVIYLGTRIKQSNAYIDRYESTDGVDFGMVRNGRFIKTCNIAPVPYRGESILGGLKGLKSSVMLIQPYVGLDYSMIVFDKSRLRAVLHTIYHSFTACTDEDGPSSILYLDRLCAENGIPLYVASFSELLLRGHERYESTEAMLRSNISFLCGHSIECSYAKLLIAVNLYDDADRINGFLSETIFYENAEIAY